MVVSLNWEDPRYGRRSERLVLEEEMEGAHWASTSSVSNPVDDGWRTGPVAALG